MILHGQRLYSDPVPCGGVLIIGDPHVSSRRPGRRTDEDWPQPILRKLEFCAQLSHEHDLVTIMLGDLFDTPVEEDEGLKTQLTRVLKGFKSTPITNTGNHDIRNTALSDGDSLAYLGTSDVVDVAAASGPVIELLVGDKRLGIGMTPYGQEIPRSVVGVFPYSYATKRFTPLLLPFQKSYPGARPPSEIEGCGMAINGHVHDTQENVRAGRTLWMNPGNITRLSANLMDQKPTVWILHGNGMMQPVELPHERNAFDLTGKFVEAIPLKDVRRDVESAFVTLLEAETGLDMAASADGAMMRESIDAKVARDGMPEAVHAMVLELLVEAVGRRNA